MRVVYKNRYACVFIDKINIEGGFIVHEWYSIVWSDAYTDMYMKGECNKQCITIKYVML